MGRCRALAFGAVLGMVSQSVFSEQFPAHFDFLYIDANVGTSSGGHVALRIGDDVFHYQHDAEGFVVLARDEWSHFRLIYNDLDNRNVHVARVTLETEDLERVRDRFVQRHLVQNRHLDFLASLRLDFELLQHFRDGQAPLIPGAGFFVATTQDVPELRQLGAQITTRFGAGFLHRKIAELERLLGSHRHTNPNLDRLDVADSRFPSYPATFSQVYLENLSKLFALSVLSGGWASADEAFLDPGRYGVSSARVRLTGKERTQFERLQEQLRTSILGLLESPRSDSGFPLLLALARYLAIAQSLSLDHLVLIHPFSGLAANMAVPDSRDQQRSLELLTMRFAASFQETRSAFFGLDELDEASLNLFENSAARYFETLRGVREHRPFRLPAGIVFPTAARAASPVVENMPEAESSRTIEEAEADYRVFRERLRAIYPYNLVARNCATELVRTLNSAFSTEDEATRALGGLIDADGVLVRMPFRLYDLVAERFRTERRSVLPSYRNRKLAAFSSMERPLWIYLAESNTVTSTLYRRRRGDSAFLLFTEEVPWLRPAYGAVNLSYGLVHAGTGLMTAPFDRGERFIEGLRGVLFSLPELAFVNIRKGSFAVLDNR